MSKRHIKQWEHNRHFLQTIEPAYPDWAVTVVFYTALHAVDALMHSDGVASIHSHESRNRALMKTNRYAKIWDRYQPLHDLSRTVRYLAEPHKWVSWNDLESEVIKRYLYPIEKSVQKLMDSDLEFPEIKLSTANHTRSIAAE